MDNLFEEKFDVIIIGTGLTETILAAACSRVGKSVLHLDPNDFYSDVWANFTFKQFNEFTEKLKTPIESVTPVNGIAWQNYHKILDNIEQTCYVTDGDETNGSEWTKRRLLSERNWGIDLAPRLLYARGSMVKLLMSSNICRYLDFGSVERILSYVPDGNDLVQVPCSRQDIFNDKYTSLIEKRILMKFITLCQDLEKNPEELNNCGDMKFVDFLTSKGLTPILQHFILNSLAMCQPDVSTSKALICIEKFLASSGVYGSTPFLLTLFGSGELPQAFCRLCAVFGGIYCFRKTIDSIVVDGSKVDSVMIGKQQIKCNYLVSGLSNAPQSVVKLTGQPKRISRAIFISNESIKKGHKGASIMRYPGDKPILVIEASWSCNVAPKGLYIVYAWCESTGLKASVDLEFMAKKLYRIESSPLETVAADLNAGLEASKDVAEKPQLLWSCYFNQLSADCSVDVEKTYENYFVTSPPFNELDYDLSIDEARNIFIKMYPNEEFLPRAPDYGEIILDDKEENKGGDAGGELTEPAAEGQ